jgi:K+-sensing histidine kinase KdpD
MKHVPFSKHESILVVIALSVVILGFVDYVTGYEVGFFLFYFLPIAITAWKVGLNSSYLISILSLIVWFLSDISSHPYSSVLFAFWNTTMRLLSFLIIAYFTSKIQFLLRKNREPSQDRPSQVKTLSGLIPICATCKKIRDQKGDWQRIEEYFEKRIDAQFTHGLCPECVDKLLKEAGVENSPPPAGRLVGTASKQTFPTRRSFRGRSQGVLLK